VTDHGGDASSALSKLLRQPIPAIRPVYLGPYPPAHLYRFFQLLELGERVRIYKGLEAEGAVLGVWIHRVRITTTPLHHGGFQRGLRSHRRQSLQCVIQRVERFGVAAQHRLG